MIVGFKDGVKLLGITVVCACAVMVCTFFLSYYLDALTLRPQMTEAMLPLYEAQLLTAQFVSAISGGCLSLVAVVLLLFYIKLYIDGHARELGVLKALGYSARRISLGFWVFGLSVLIGAAIGFGCGYAFTPLIYGSMNQEGFPEVAVRFHAELLFGLVFLPSAVFMVLSVAYAAFRLRRPALSLLRGEERSPRLRKVKEGKARPFLTEMRRDTVKSRKAIAFFIGFAGFCFGAMLQMAFSMGDYASAEMGYIIFGIGAVLSVTCLLLAVTVLTGAHARSVAAMRAYGYTLRECGGAVFGGYRIPALCGFALGTLYQFGLLKLMLEVVFRDVAYEVPAYHFNFWMCAVVLAAFVLLYETTMFVFTRKMSRLSVRNFAAE